MNQFAETSKRTIKLWEHIENMICCFLFYMYKIIVLFMDNLLNYLRLSLIEYI